MRARRIGSLPFASALSALVAVVIAGVAGGAPVSHNRDTHWYSVELTPAVVVPGPGADGARAHLDPVLVIVRERRLASLRWKLVYAGVGRRDVAAHIHVGRPGTLGPIAVSLCGPCISGARGRVELRAALARKISGSDFWPGGPRRAYVDVHTPAHPEGAVRAAFRSRAWRGDYAPG